MNTNLGRFTEFNQTTWSRFLAHLEQLFARIRENGVLIIGGGAPIYKHLSATTTWNPGSLNDDAQELKTITVAGAALGDVVTVSFSLSLQGMTLTGYVSATDTVTAVLYNGTGAPINLASGTLRACVSKYTE